MKSGEMQLEKFANAQHKLLQHLQPTQLLLLLLLPQISRARPQNLKNYGEKRHDSLLKLYGNAIEANLASTYYQTTRKHNAL